MAHVGSVDVAQAKARLTKILTQAVGIVSAAANARTFLVMKSMDPKDENKAAPAGEAPVAAPAADGAPKPEAPKPETKAPLTMPQAVKDGLTQGLAAILDIVSQVAEAITSATVDDAAEIPTEPLFMLDDAAAQLDALADKFIMEEEMGEPVAGAPVDGMGEAQMAAPDPAAKLAPATKAKVKADEMPRRKARLIAKKRLGTMKAAHGVIGDGHAQMAKGMDQLDGLMKELAGEMAPPGKEEKAKPPEPKPEEKKPDMDAEKVAKSIETAVVSAVEKLIGDKIASIAERVSKVEKAAPRSNAQTEEVNAATQPVREQSFKEKLEAAKAAQKK